MKVKLNWGNSIKNFQTSIKNTKKHVEKDVAKVVDSTSSSITQDARENTPIDTGKLKNSWKQSKTGRGKKRKVTISNDVDYAEKVEYGTSKTPPRRMLTKAMKKGEITMKRKLNNINLNKGFK